MPTYEERKRIREVSGAGEAYRIVSRAVRHGEIPPARQLACADCGAQALHYDHRDYGRPLDVQPVCRSCNYRRGSAIWREAAEPSPQRSQSGPDLLPGAAALFPDGAVPAVRASFSIRG
jgi:hypothetical protein